MFKKSLIYKPYVSNRQKPVNFREEDAAIFSLEFSRNIEAVYMLDIAPAVMLGNGHIYNNLKFVPASDILQLSGRGYILEILKALRTRKRKLSDERPYYSFINSNWKGYFHWITDCLPKLFLIRDSIEEYNILVPQEMSDFHRVTLEPFGIRHKTSFRTEEVLKAPRLKLPSNTARSGNYNKHVIHGLKDFLLDHFLEGSGQKGPEKIYISRKMAGKRSIANESEVEALLERRGYTSVIMENYSFGEQVNLMSGCRRLISLHGAGLTNMLFMPEGSRVLELRHEDDRIRNCYFTLASELGFPYHYLLCAGTDPDHSPHEADHIVDLEALERIVDAMG